MCYCDFAPLDKIFDIIVIPVVGSDYENVYVSQHKKENPTIKPKVFHKVFEPAHMFSSSHH